MVSNKFFEKTTDVIFMEVERRMVYITRSVLFNTMNNNFSKKGDRKCHIEI